MNRKEFLLLATAGGLATQLRASGTPTKNSDKRPNILFIMTDQQFADAMSCAGDPHLHTPNMDWLAEQGTRFEKAYCPHPICAPSRASMITGRMPHEIGVNYNMDEKHIDAPSIGKLMKEAGYDTGYVGKWHIPMANDNHEWHGFDMIKHAVNNGIDPLIAEPSIEFLQRKREQPFFLVSSFVNPHDICEWARMASGIEDRFRNGEIPPAPPADQCPPLPENFEIPADEPSVIRELQSYPDAIRTYPVGNWTPDTWRQYRWAYNRMTEMVDAHIGKILDALRESGQLDDTVIVFTSDHGDGVGAHQWNQKTVLYEESVRVPFIMVHPGGAKNAVNNNTLINIGTDLAATFMDYAGGTLNSSYHGKSLRPTMQGESTHTHDFVVAETNLAPYYDEGGRVNGRMLRTQRYKYTLYSEGTNREQLHDLDADPGEMKNLAKDPAHAETLQEHRQLLSKWIRKTKDFFPDPLRDIPA